MTAQTITIAGARGGSGTSTIAAALALLIAGHASTELVADDLADLIGVGETGPLPFGVDSSGRVFL